MGKWTDWECSGGVLSHSVMSTPWTVACICPWNSPGKNTGVGSHSFSRGSSQSRNRTRAFYIAGGFFTILCHHSLPPGNPKVKVLIAQSRPTLCDPKDCSPPGSSVHGILQARILEWVTIRSPGDLPNPGIEPGSPTLQANSSLSELPGKPVIYRFWR